MKGRAILMCRNLLRISGIILAMLAAVPAAAQGGSRSNSADQRTAASPEPLGQRRTREQLAPKVPPLARVETRIAGRIQSRIRTRIDPSSNSQVNFGSLFVIAEQQSRTVGNPPRP